MEKLQLLQVMRFLIISGQRPTPSIMANALDVVERSGLVNSLAR